MTDETKKRLPGIIERIDELMDEVEKISRVEADEYFAKHDAMNEVCRIYEAGKLRQINEVHASLDDAARLLENF